MTRRDASGYDPDDSDDSPRSRIQQWELRERETRYADYTLAQLIVDGEARGLLRFEDDKEFEWFRDQIDSERKRPRSDGS